MLVHERLTLAYELQILHTNQKKNNAKEQRLLGDLVQLVVMAQLLPGLQEINKAKLDSFKFKKHMPNAMTLFIIQVNACEWSNIALAKEQLQLKNCAYRHPETAQHFPSAA